ncbi:hypothetical protein PENSUB_9534 [Penicillium subrubescens]|uniref:Uncharacterized protein n=1 Tax=Penicillium subrubescens TaxID=1316194 RepID=A0A1Q5TD05_9EURO|nr:hypothetical protein PENSUB_9534 [Penicillium subrubescens]
MSDALKQVIEGLISMGPDSCSHCVGGGCIACNANTEESCCDGTYMTSQVESLRNIIENPTNQQSTLQAINRIKDVSSGATNEYSNAYTPTD